MEARRRSARRAALGGSSGGTAQGVPMEYGRDRRDLDVRAINALHTYVRERGSVRADPRGTAVAM